MPCQEVSDSDLCTVPFIGLKNRGNTCYLNSILQVLYYCPLFSDKLSTLSLALSTIDQTSEEDQKVVKCKESFSLVQKLINLFSHLSGNQMRLIEERNKLSEDEMKSLSAVCPQDFITCLRSLYPMFEPYTQQDAQECFHCILNICNSALSILNESEQENATVLYRKSDSKVVGGRRSSSISVLTSNQNTNTTNSSVCPGAKPVFVHSRNDTECQENITSQLSTHSDGCDRARAISARDENTSPPSAGCFKGLKRKQLKIGGKAAKDHQELKDADKKFEDLSQEKENLLTTTEIPSSSGSTSEPASKKRRLGSNVRIVAPPQRTFLKNLWKTKASHILVRAGNSKSKPMNATVTYSCADDSVSLALNKDGQQLKEATAKSFLDTDFVKGVFQGELVTTTKCVECETAVRRYETFQDVSLPVKDTQLNKSVESLTDSAGDWVAKETETCNLAWALDHFSATEALCGENKYFCDTCLRLSEGQQNMLFKKLPPVLTLHMKRFAAASAGLDGLSPTVSKITSALEVPSEICFKQWCSSDCSEKDATYQLFGIVIHSGLTITGGHYLSYVKYNKSQPENDVLTSYYGKWLELDDDRVRVLSNNETDKALSHGDFDTPTKSAYMLFYHRVVEGN